MSRMVSKSRPRRPRNITLPSLHMLTFPQTKILRLPNILYTPKNNGRLFLRDCISRVSYNSPGKNSDSIAKSTYSSIAYLLKNEDVSLMASSKALTNIDYAQEFFYGKQILRIMISPEDDDAPLEECVYNTIHTIESAIGQRITYLAAIHTDTDHLHAHIVISREDGGKCSSTNLLRIPKKIIIDDCRNSMKLTITRKLGFLTEKDRNKKYEKNLDKIASAKIDYLIKKELTPYTDKLGISVVDVDTLIKNMPLSFRGYTTTRLDFLSKIGGDIGIEKFIDTDNKEKIVFRNRDWQEFLRSKEKSNLFQDTTKNKGVFVDNYTVARQGRLDYKATIVDKKIIDHDRGIVAFLLQDEKKDFHYIETQLQYNEYEFFKKGDYVKAYGRSQIRVTKTETKKQSRVKITKLDKETGKIIKPPQPEIIINKEKERALALSTPTEALTKTNKKIIKDNKDLLIE